VDLIHDAIPISDFIRFETYEEDVFLWALIG
jgi:hypothetical protein